MPGRLLGATCWHRACCAGLFLWRGAAILAVWRCVADRATQTSTRADSVGVSGRSCAGLRELARNSSLLQICCIACFNSMPQAMPHAGWQSACVQCRCPSSSNNQSGLGPCNWAIACKWAHRACRHSCAIFCCPILAVLRVLKQAISVLLVLMLQWCS